MAWTRSSKSEFKPGHTKEAVQGPAAHEVPLRLWDWGPRRARGSSRRGRRGGWGPGQGWAFSTLLSQGCSGSRKHGAEPQHSLLSVFLPTGGRSTANPPGKAFLSTWWVPLRGLPEAGPPTQHGEGIKKEWGPILTLRTRGFDGGGTGPNLREP